MSDTPRYRIEKRGRYTSPGSIESVPILTRDGQEIADRDLLCDIANILTETLLRLRAVPTTEALIERALQTIADPGVADRINRLTQPSDEDLYRLNLRNQIAHARSVIVATEAAAVENVEPRRAAELQERLTGLRASIETWRAELAALEVP